MYQARKIFDPGTQTCGSVEAIISRYFNSLALPFKNLVMKGKFTFRCACMAALLLTTTVAQAKIWRVNNNFGVRADFTQLNEAAINQQVNAGDTIYLEGSSTAYSGFNLYKRLVIIGPGYLLSGTTGNAGLQANPNSATITMYVDSLASGSVFMGLDLTANMHGGTDNIRFERCYLSIGQWTTGRIMSNLVINKCFIHSHRFTTYPTENLEVTNCIFETSVSYMAGMNSLYRNNIFFNAHLTISNAYISNNIFVGSNFTPTSCTIKYNLSSGNNLPAGNGNVNGVPAGSLFVGGSSRDGKHMLSATSPARGAGEPIEGITPDCGAYGTPDPYRLSGIPPIPTIYELTVPASVPSTSSVLPVIVSTRSNN
jgi:hypothetical protein